MQSKRVPFIDVAKLLYPDGFEVHSTINQLAVKNVLCLSDTDQAFVSNKTQPSRSIAVHLERELSETKSVPLVLTQADCTEFKYDSPGRNFGAHLPQNKDETRREYRQINNAKFNVSDHYDLILGRGLLCCCFKPVSCGGICPTYQEQKKFIDSLLATKANLIVLNSNALGDEYDPTFFLKGKKELLETCKSIALFSPDYEVIFGDNLAKHLSGGQVNLKNSGHIIILAKRSVIEIDKLPKDAIRFGFKENVDRLVCGVNLFKFYSKLPKKLILKNATADSKEILSVTLNELQQNELYNLRDLIGKEIITKQKGEAVYEINCDYLAKLKVANPEGFDYVSRLFNVSKEKLAAIVSSDLSLEMTPAAAPRIQVL